MPTKLTASPTSPAVVNEADGGGAPAIDDALFVSEDDNVVDGSHFDPGDRFTKVWIVRNNGTTTWDAGYRVRLVAGPSLGAPPSAPVPETAPGQIASIRVEFQPTEPTDLVRSEWRLANAQGSPFGQPMWTDILVVDPDAENADPDQTFPPPNDQLVDAPADAGYATVVAATFWNRYGGLILDECLRLNIDPADAVGVLVAESKGQPFDEDRRLIVRFENHLFWHYWGKANPGRFQAHFKMNPDKNWDSDGQFWRPDAGGTWQPCHILGPAARVGNAREWQVLDFARHLDDRAALLSISMGAPQIMGFNHAAVGYPSPQAMFQAFGHDAGVQLRALFRFMEVNNLVEAVQRKDYRQFALVYNGPGQPDYYGGLMRDYAAAFAALRPSVVATPAAAPQAAPSQAAPPPVPVQAPMPASPQPGVPLAVADPELYAAWRAHIEQGFKNNETMFARVLEAFMNPYWSTVWMYRILFGVGIAAFVVAALVALFQNNIVTTLVFGGLSVTAFLSFFVSRPLQALEENLQFITWLGIIYNTYWTSLVQSQDPATYNQDVDQATNDAIDRIQTLMAAHAERSGARPDAED